MPKSQSERGFRSKELTLSAELGVFAEPGCEFSASVLDFLIHLILIFNDNTYHTEAGRLIQLTQRLPIY